MTSLIAVLLATLPCTLSKSDYAALAHAKAKPLSRAAVGALEPEAQTELCKARALAKKVATLTHSRSSLSHEEVDALAGKIDQGEFPIGLSQFVTPEEFAVLNPLGIALSARSMDSKGLVSSAAAPTHTPAECSLDSLTEADYASLASADPPLKREQVAALPDVDKQQLCLARRLLKLVESGKTAKDLTEGDIPIGLERWMTEVEYDKANPVAIAVMAHAMSGHP